MSGGLFAFEQFDFAYMSGVPAGARAVVYGLNGPVIQGIDIYTATASVETEAAISLAGLSLTSLSINLSNDEGSVGIIDNVVLSDATTPIPEPGTMLLLASGLIGLVGFRRKFKK